MTKLSKAAARKELALARKELDESLALYGIPPVDYSEIDAEQLGAVGRRRKVQSASFEVGRDFSTLAFARGVEVKGVEIGQDIETSKTGIIERARIIDVAVARRVLQAKKRAIKVAIGATVTDAQGVYEGYKERSLAFRMDYVPTMIWEPTFRRFAEDILDLAQELCSRFAQKEIRVTFHTSDPKWQGTWPVSPKGFPPPEKLDDEWLAGAKKARRKGKERFLAYLAETGGSP